MNALAELQRLGLKIVLSSSTTIKIIGLSQLSNSQQQETLAIAKKHKESLLVFLKAECIRQMGDFPLFEQYLYLTTKDCPKYPMGCFECPYYRGVTVYFCKIIHWWKPWPMPDTGELPKVTCWHGHVWHTYKNGTTRFVGYLKNKTTIDSSQTKQDSDEVNNVQ